MEEGCESVFSVSRIFFYLPPSPYLDIKVQGFSSLTKTRLSDWNLDSVPPDGKILNVLIFVNKLEKFCRIFMD